MLLCHDILYYIILATQCDILVLVVTIMFRGPGLLRGVGARTRAKRARGSEQFRKHLSSKHSDFAPEMGSLLKRILPFTKGAYFLY